jgi:hypothetical protein
MDVSERGIVTGLRDYPKPPREPRNVCFDHLASRRSELVELIAQIA